MSETSNLALDTLAPEFSLPASIGNSISLADYRTKNNVYLFFVREFIWMQCRSHAAQLGRLYNEFKANNCEILLILGEPLDKAKRYAEILHLPFPVLADPGRKIYHLYGLEKALVFIQRTASVVIDKNGVIRYLRTTTNPMVWLEESKELLGIVKSISDKS